MEKQYNFVIVTKLPKINHLMELQIHDVLQRATIITKADMIGENTCRALLSMTIPDFPDIRRYFNKWMGIISIYKNDFPNYELPHNYKLGLIFATFSEIGELLYSKSYVNLVPESARLDGGITFEGEYEETISDVKMELIEMRWKMYQMEKELLNFKETSKQVEIPPTKIVIKGNSADDNLLLYEKSEPGCITFTVTRQENILDTDDIGKYALALHSGNTLSVSLHSAAIPGKINDSINTLKEIKDSITNMTLLDLASKLNKLESTIGNCISTLQDLHDSSFYSGNQPPQRSSVVPLSANTNLPPYWWTRSPVEWQELLKNNPKAAEDHEGR